MGVRKQSLYDTFGDKRTLFLRAEHGSGCKAARLDEHVTPIPAIDEFDRARGVEYRRSRCTAEGEVAGAVAAVGAGTLL